MPGLGVVVLLFGLRAAQGSATVDPQIVALILVGLVVVLVIGVVVPVATMRRITVTARCPLDAVVGTESPVTVSVGGRADRLAVRILDPRSEWFRTSAPAEGVIPHLAVQRGVFKLVRVEVVTTWPLGLFSVGRVFELALPQEVWVGPSPLPMSVPPRPRPDDGGPDARTSLLGGDTVRSVRPYQVGDPPRMVHWPSTARAATLVVRELDPPVRNGLVVVLDLRGHPLSGFGQPSIPAVEQAVSRTAGLVANALRTGSEVLLSTYELDGGHLAPVSSTLEASRRLASAIRGEPPPAPPGWAAEVIRP